MIRPAAADRPGAILPDAEVTTCKVCLTGLTKFGCVAGYRNRLNRPTTAAHWGSSNQSLNTVNSVDEIEFIGDFLASYATQLVD